MSDVSASGQVESSGSNSNPAPDAHAKPPESIKSFYKCLQKCDKYELSARRDLVDCDVHSESFSKHLVKQCTDGLPSGLQKTFAAFTGGGAIDEREPPKAHTRDNETDQHDSRPPVVFQPHDMPGLFIYPSLLPRDVQFALLDRLLHRDLSNPEHATNVHLHYDVPYPPPTSESGVPASFFDSTAADLVYKPKFTHQSIGTQKFLEKKLRWITLGGQYDWTNKVYPAGPPPAFPADIKTLVDDIFPMKAEAAIVNLYSPGETLSVHRDVSEECAQPLVSISLGCEAVFVVGSEARDGNTKNPRIVPIKLRSGDAVLMSGESRYAWHGVPKIIPETCPDWLQDWPAVGVDENRENMTMHKGWMSRKRINLNVRQMFAASAAADAEGSLAGGRG